MPKERLFRFFKASIIRITCCLIFLFFFCEWSLAQQAECSFWSSFEFFEYSYSFINDTDHTLTFTVTESETIFHPEFSFTTNLIPAGMGMNMYPLKVYPENVFGTDTVTITITSSDDPNLIIKEYQFTHNRVAATGAILVLDKSGSMGLQGKMQAAKTAAGAFIDSILPSIFSSSGFQNNRYGAVLFNQSASILDISPIMPPLIDFEVPGEWINPYVISSLNAVEPGGFTSIGGGLRSARMIIEGQAVDMRRVVLLLSDGKENRTPWISSETDSLVSDVIKVYSIGLGYDYLINSEKLSDLSNSTGGKYRHIDDPDDLTKFFMEVLADAFDMSVLVDPKGTVSSGSPQRHEIPVSSLDQKLIFVLSWRDPEKDLDFKLITPSGEISASNLPDGVQYIDRKQAYKIFKVPVSGRQGAEIAPGEWAVEISAGEGVTEYYSFVVLTKSGINLLAKLPISQVFVGDDIPISATFLVNGNPVQDANIEVKISSIQENFNDLIARAKTDIKSLSRVRASDAHWTLKDRKGWMVYRGKPLKRKEIKVLLKPRSDREKRKAGYTTVFQKIKFPGNYDLTYRATWKTPKGETVIRECNRTIFVNAKSCLKTSNIKSEIIKKDDDKALHKIRVYFAPKDQENNYLGLGLKDEIILIGPVSNNKGFTDLGNGWYRIDTQVAKETCRIFLRFRGNIWQVPLVSSK